MFDTQRMRDPYAVLQVRPDAEQTVLTAAYRALAALYHPDRNQEPGAAARMRELNAAYAAVRTPEGRANVDDRLRAPAPSPAAASPEAAGPPKPTTRPRPAATRSDGDSLTVDFGRYAGWTIADLARHDADYLRWLSRHSAGQRYRSEIARRLVDAAAPRAGSATRAAPPARRWAMFGGRG